MDTLPGMVQVVALALRFVGLRMVPLIVSTIYHVLKHTFTYLYRTLTWCLVPVLLPLRILFYQPVMALASLLYNVRSDLHRLAVSSNSSQFIILSQQLFLTPWIHSRSATSSTLQEWPS